jgi:hypothetical protein
MAKFSQTLGEVSTSISPVAPVQGPSGASLIKDLGNLAIEGAKTAIVGGAREEAEQLASDFIQETDQLLTASEAAEADNFEKRLNALQSVADSTGKIEQVRTRAAALYKNKVNSFPGLENQLRASMSKVLGFDPSGAGVRAREDQIESEAKTAQKMMADADKQAQKLGFAAGDIFTGPKKQQAYLAAVEDQRFLMDLERRVKTNEATDALTVDARFEAGDKEAAKFAEVRYNDSIRQVQTFLSERGIAEAEYENGITPEIYNRIGPEEWQGLVNSLNTIKATTSREMQTRFNKLGQNFIEAAQQETFARIDGLITKITGKDLLARDMLQYDMHSQVILGKIKDEPAFDAIASWTATTDSPLPPALVNAHTTQISLPLARGTFTPSQATIEPEAVKTATSNEVSGTVQLLQQTLDAANNLANSNLKTEQKQQVADAFSKFAEAMATGSEDYFMHKTAADSWMDILGDSESLELIKETEKSNPFLVQSLVAFTSTHANKTKVAAEQKLLDVLNTFQVTKTIPVWHGKRLVKEEKETTPLLTPTFEGGVFDLKINEEAVKQLKPGLFDVKQVRGRTVSSPAMKRLTAIRKSAVADMNRVFKATKNINGWTDEKTKDFIFSTFFAIDDE